MKIFVAASVFFALVYVHAEAQEDKKGFAVVELFTSEGCSSCPPADIVLSDILRDAEKNHTKIFCLEYHVDYWNHGGWKDPFSKNQFTLRQNNYSAVLQQRELYTPQMIVNGETEFTGSHAGEANTAVQKALRTPAEISLSFHADSVAQDTMYVQYRSSRSDKNFSLHFAVVESHLISKVGKGENSGKTLSHDNVVRIFYSLGLTDKIGFVKIPLKGFRINSSCNIIAFVQHKQTMKIVEAEENKMPGF